MRSLHCSTAILTAALAVAVAAPACADVIPLGGPGNTVALTFDGTVSYRFDDSVTVRNLDSSTVTFDKAAFTDRAIAEWAAVLDGIYTVGYTIVPNYQYDSVTGALFGFGNPCVSAFSCPEDVGNGTLDRLRFPIQITGDFGRVRPGFNVGYDAGRAGFLDLIGSFTSGGGQPTPVPAPGMLLVFGLGALGVMGRRRFGKKGAVGVKFPKLPA